MSEKPYFIAVGRYVEDTRGNRPDLCVVPYEDDAMGWRRTHKEACAIAEQIADAMNRLYPNANPKAKP